MDEQGQLDLRIWGKRRGLDSAYPLLWHAVDTAAVALTVWDLYLPPHLRRVIAAGLGVDPDQARGLVALWAGLHDIGKITPGFQAQVPESTDVLAEAAYPPVPRAHRISHQRASQAALGLLLADRGYPPGRDKARDTWHRVAQIAGGHHGRFVESARGDRLLLGEAAWADQRRLLYDVLHGALGRPKPPMQVRGCVAVLVTGIVILSDWLASQEHHLTEQLAHLPASAGSTVVRDRLHALAGAAEELLRQAGLLRPAVRRVDFQRSFGFTPNPLQQSIVDELLPDATSTGLLVVTAATGDGKTEAALTAATALAEVAGASGFYFALPTMATSDEMYRRVRRFAAKVVDGPAATTLLHSMAWLTAEYEQRSAAGLADSVEVVAGCEDDQLDPPVWLRGRKRGLLAPLAVGTVDQALVAALPTKHNALRMLGLAGKVFIVDEAHAYDDYMRALLERLLSWLGAFGCPVVLLSATLPSGHVRGLVRAYVSGAGREAPEDLVVRYPGWLFVPATSDQSPVVASERAHGAISAGRRIELKVEVVGVRHRHGPDRTDPLDRRTVLADVLAPVTREPGHVAVVCNTVDDAQRTFSALAAWGPAGVDVQLLHSRFPAYRREEITERILHRIGKGGDRAGASITVATQVIEQSLDLDFDLVVSDLAPLAQLLQRAGRCRRHPLAVRPAWARSTRLVVLEPQGAAGYQRPAHWGEVYDGYLLAATRRVLAELPGQLQVPDDVQHLMETVYTFSREGVPADLRSLYDIYRFTGDGQRTLAGYVRIPSAADEFGGLHRLSDKQVEEADASTRLGAASVRVICCYQDEDGRQWLDPARQLPLPVQGTGPRARFTTPDVRAILGHSLPVRTTLLGTHRTELPHQWRDNAWLSDLLLLCFPLGPDGPQPLDLDGRTTYLDPNLGLVSRRGNDDPQSEEAR